MLVFMVLLLYGIFTNKFYLGEMLLFCNQLLVFIVVLCFKGIMIYNIYIQTLRMQNGKRVKKRSN